LLRAVDDASKRKKDKSFLPDFELERCPNSRSDADPGERSGRRRALRVEHLPLRGRAAEGERTARGNARSLFSLSLSLPSTRLRKVEGAPAKEK
jgi:hypothetical protein